MVARGKGLIAADESAHTCETRFNAVGLSCTEETRRDFREVLLGAPGMEEYVSGVILFDETIRQKTSDGTPFAQMLSSHGILPGIKVDAGTKDFGEHASEKITEGLEGLPRRMWEYAALGAKFAKWRAIITIGPDMPSDRCISANADALAKYARISQENGLVPIIEPEILIDGDHSIEACFEATSQTLARVFLELTSQAVAFDAIILKASMVIAGTDAPQKSSPEDVAKWTLKCLSEHVSAEIPGVVFLSGGQSDEQATANLNAMNKAGGAAWPLTFSYSRAIQHPVLDIWAHEHDKEKARAALMFRLKMNSLASTGTYDPRFETQRPY